MSKDGIEPNDLWAQTTAIPATPPPSAPPTRQLIIIGAIAFVVMLIVGLILTLSLGGDDTSTSIATTSTSSSTSVPSSTTLPTSIVTTLVPTTVEETTTTSSTTVVGITANQPITIAGGLGIGHFAEGKTTRIDSNPWAIAFRLADGSYIAQHVTPNSGQQGDSAIYRVGATTTAIMSAPNPDTDWIRLHDVYTESGSTFVLYSLDTNFISPDAKEELFALDLNTGLTTSFSVVGGMNSGVSRLTYGSNIIVGEKFEEANAGPFFFNLDGYTINPNDLGLADSYDNCTVCPSKFTVDPSGQRLAWIEADLLVVLDRTSASRIAEIPLPKGLYASINSLDIFGDLILINIYDANSGAMGKPILMSFAGTSMTLDTAGTATFDQ